MPNPNLIYEDFGGLSLPLEAADVTTTLTPLDPAKAMLVALFKAALNAELGDVWTKVTNTLATDHPLRNTNPVQSTLELPPTPENIGQVKKTFPLLCVHRSGRATAEEYLLSQDKVTQTWDVHYILAPTDVGDCRKLLDVCVAVPKILRLVIRKRGHPQYQSGALQFFDGQGTLASVNLTGWEGPVQASFAPEENAPTYHAVVMQLETTELTYDDIDAYGGLEASTFEIGAGDDQGIYPGLIYADTTAPEGE